MHLQVGGGEEVWLCLKSFSPLFSFPHSLFFFLLLHSRNVEFVLLLLDGHQFSPVEKSVAKSAKVVSGSGTTGSCGS